MRPSAAPGGPVLRGGAGAEQALLSEREAQFLRMARVGRLATADASGRPHVVPVVFVWHEGFIYTPIDGKPKGDPRRLRRLRNIRENPRVAFLVDRYEEDWTRLGFLLLRGRADILEGEGTAGERGAAEGLLREKYPQYREVPLGGPEGLLIRVAAEGRASWGNF